MVPTARVACPGTRTRAQSAGFYFPNSRKEVPTQRNLTQRKSLVRRLLAKWAKAQGTTRPTSSTPKGNQKGTAPMGV